VWNYKVVRASRFTLLFYAAAATTAIAGIMHLVLAPNLLGFNINFALFFIVAGIAQLFWVLPMIKSWGFPWYVVGIVGMAVLISLFVITRMPNPITGRGLPTNSMALVIEIMQAAFITLCAIIIVYEAKRKQLDRKTRSDST
jgi:hypothetical protein